MHACIKIIMNTNTNLNLLCKTIASDSENDKLTITGLASSTDQDLDGESVSYKALVQMYEKVVGLSLFLEHQHHLESVIGTITNAELKGTELYITAEILDTHKEFVKGLLDSNVNLGFSIGGIATFNQQDKSVMEDFNLLEVSLVSLPANWSSFGTVVEEKSVTCTCLTAGLHELKHIGDKENMAEEQIQNIEPTAEEIIKSEAIPEEPVVAEEVEEKAVEVSEEKSEAEEIVEEAIPEIEEKSEDIVEDAPESEEAEKALDSEEDQEEAPKFLTADDIGVILESYMAEKEEQITANVLAALQKELSKKEASVEEVEAEEKSEEVETEKSVETKSVEAEPVEEPVSKYASYTEEQAQEKSFLDSEERDFLGRNLKYL